MPRPDEYYSIRRELHHVVKGQRNCLCTPESQEIRNKQWFWGTDTISLNGKVIYSSFYTSQTNSQSFLVLSFDYWSVSKKRIKIDFSITFLLSSGHLQVGHYCDCAHAPLDMNRKEEIGFPSGSIFDRHKVVRDTESWSYKSYFLRFAWFFTQYVADVSSYYYFYLLKVRHSYCVRIVTRSVETCSRLSIFLSPGHKRLVTMAWRRQKKKKEMGTCFLHMVESA